VYAGWKERKSRLLPPQRRVQALVLIDHNKGTSNACKCQINRRILSSVSTARC
jgi:hypothetical protein